MTHHLIGDHASEEMRRCIELCSDCHDACLETLSHCLGRGGEHAAPEHVRALLDCAQTCEASRDFMLRGSDLHGAMCGVCADACEHCAQSCEEIGAQDDVMRNCAELCRRCAESCRSMAGARAR
jgi:hypothetical protein